MGNAKSAFGKFPPCHSKERGNEGAPSSSFRALERHGGESVRAWLSRMDPRRNPASIQCSLALPANGWLHPLVFRRGFVRRGFVRSILGRGQRQLRSAAQQAALLGRELVLETVGIDDLLPLVGWHGAEIADCGTQFLPAIGRQISELRKQLPRLLLLIGSQVLPGFHALQDAVLLLLREAAETQQPFPQDLLPGRRKVAELGIVVESFLLLIGRQVLVTAEPLSGVT